MRIDFVEWSREAKVMLCQTKTFEIKPQIITNVTIVVFEYNLFSQWKSNNLPGVLHHFFVNLSMLTVVHLFQ